MTKDLLLATGNEHKLEEFQAVLGPLGYHVHSLKEFPAYVEPLENGKTYRENAFIKARSAASLSSFPVLADDSGIEILALGPHFPGVSSHRYARSLGATYAISNAAIIKLLEGNPERRACFHCCICLLPSKDAEPLYFEGLCPGRITEKPYGSEGFGYDPIFYSDEARICFGLASHQIKNRYSHRAKALLSLIAYLKEEG